jgi:hypothetical protein
MVSERIEPDATVRLMATKPPAMVVLDDDGNELRFDADEAARLFALTGDLDAATVSACPQCRSRILAAVALVDLIEDAPPLPRATALTELADDAPTLHLYVRDVASRCSHGAWKDPGFDEWAEAMADLVDHHRAM